MLDHGFKKGSRIFSQRAIEFILPKLIIFLWGVVGKNHRIAAALDRFKIVSQLIDQGMALLAEGVGIIYFFQKIGGGCHAIIGFAEVVASK
jgi:hypothetical protein